MPADPLRSTSRCERQLPAEGCPAVPIGQCSSLAVLPPAGLKRDPLSPPRDKTLLLFLDRTSDGNG